MTASKSKCSKSNKNPFYERLFVLCLLLVPSILALEVSCDGKETEASTLEQDVKLPEGTLQTMKDADYERRKFKFAKSRLLCDQALKEIEKSLALEERSTALNAAKARLLWMKGEMDSWDRKYKSASDLYDEGLNCCKIAANQNDANLVGAKSKLLNFRADLKLKQNDVPEAVKNFDESIAVCNDFLKTQKENRDILYCKSQALVWEGQHLLKSRNLEQAESNGKAALEIFNRLTRDGSQPFFLQRKSTAMHFLADVYLAAGRTVDARTILEQSVILDSKLIEEGNADELVRKNLRKAQNLQKSLTY